MTYLFISHDLAVVDHGVRRGRRAVPGRVVEQGAPDELFRAPRTPTRARCCSRAAAQPGGAQPRTPQAAAGAAQPAAPRAALRHRPLPQRPHCARWPSGHRAALPCAERDGRAPPAALPNRLTTAAVSLHADPDLLLPPRWRCAPPADARRRRKDSVVLAWCSSPRRAWTRPPAPAAAIGEIVHYNILEGLTKINVDGTVTPLLAESWSDRPRRQELHLQAAQGREVPGRRALRRQRREVQLRARQGRRLDQQGQEGGVRQHQPHRHARRAHGDPGAEQRRRQLPVPPGREHRRDPRPEERRHHRHQAGRHRPVQASTTGTRARRSRWSSGDGYRNAAARQDEAR